MTETNNPEIANVNTTSTDFVIPDEDKGKNPWDMNWGMEASAASADTPDVAPESTKNPWDMDWGITNYLKIIPQAVNVVQRGIQDLTFNRVFNKLIQAESRGKHTDASGNLTASPAGAKGITQVMRKTGEDPGYGVEPLKNQSEEEYIRFGKEYLRAMLKEFNGDYRKALAAYNAGPGSVQKAVAKGGENWMEFLPKKSETIPYVNQILGEV